MLYLSSASLFGTTFSNQIYPIIYPFIIHFPLTLFLTLYYKYPLMSSFISVLSAYMCCQISNWLGSFILSITNMEWCYYLTRIIITMITFFVLCQFICKTTASIFAKAKQELSVIGFFPFVYYIFDYISTKFSTLLYSGNKVIVEFMSFAFCIAYLIFLLIYFKEYTQMQEAKQYSNLMELQLLSIENEIENVKATKYTLSILKHDTRHHLNILLTLLQNNNTDKAIDYISKLNKVYDDTTFITYSKNEMLNSILSIYQMRFAEKEFDLNCNISCENNIFSEIAFCAILSNALENALHTLETITIEKKWATLTISNNENHLLLKLENPIEEIPTFIDGIPVSNKNGHGIGTKSIVYYVEKLNGQWHFSILNNCFILRIII